MPAQWTGKITGTMHINRISNSMLAKQLNVTAAYVSMILNGKKEPKNAEQRFTDALNVLIMEQNKTG